MAEDVNDLLDQADRTSDLAKAVDLERRAAELGSAAAYVRLGDRHFRGRGLPDSKEQAMAMYAKAAELGSLDGMSNCASTPAGEKWISIAAAAGQPYAVTRLTQLAKTNPARAAELAALPARHPAYERVVQVAGEAAEVISRLGVFAQSLRVRWPAIRWAASSGGRDITIATINGSSDVRFKDYRGFNVAVAAAKGRGPSWTLTVSTGQPHGSPEDIAVIDALVGTW